MSALVAPEIRFYGPERSPNFIGEGANWHRMEPADEARLGTGFDLETDEPEVGIAITKRGVDTVEIAFDLIRLGMKLRPAIVERLREKWESQLSAKTPQRLRARSHFSVSFAQFSTHRQRVEDWRQFLDTILSDLSSYQKTPTQTRKRKAENDDHTPDSL